MLASYPPLHYTAQRINNRKNFRSSPIPFFAPLLWVGLESGSF